MSIRISQISATGLAFGFFPIGLSFFLQGSSSFNSVGMAGIPWVIMSEIFPINVKAPAGSLVTLVNCGHVLGLIVTYTFNFMLEWSSRGTFFMFAGVYVVTVLFIAKIVTETKGRTLEDFRLGKVSPEAPTTIILRVDYGFSVSKK